MSYLVLSNRKRQATLRVTISRNRRDPPPTHFQVDAAALKCSRRQVSHTHTTTAHHTLPFPIPFLSSLRPLLAALPLPPPPQPGWPRATPTSPWRSPPAASARGSPRPRRSAGSSRRPARTRRPAATTRSARGSSSARGSRSGSWAVRALPLLGHSHAGFVIRYASLSSCFYVMSIVVERSRWGLVCLFENAEILIGRLQCFTLYSSNRSRFTESQFISCAFPPMKSHKL